MKDLIEEIRACKRCELHETATQKVFGKGSQTPKILFIGEAPGAKEDETGVPFIGPSGKLLSKWIEYLGYNEDEYAVVNLLKCRPPANADPTVEQLESCREWLDRQIDILNPDVIFLVGRFAAQEVAGVGGSITQYAGRVIEKDGRKYVPIAHPSYYLRHGGKGWEGPLDDAKKQLENLELRDFVANANKFNKQIKELTLATQEGPEKKIQEYVPIHVHTTFSITDSATRLDEIAKFAKLQGFEALAITDHGTVGGWVEFQNACDAEGIKPLLGIEFYLVDSYSKDTKERYHVVVIAKGEKGIKSIFKMNDLSHKEFYYRSRLSIEDFFSMAENVVVTSACTSGLVSAHILKDNPLAVEEYTQALKDKFGDDFYIELQPHDFDLQEKTNPVLLELARRFDIRLVVTTDTHYILNDGKEAHNALKAISYRKKMGEAGFSIDTNYIPDAKEMVELFEKVGVGSSTVKEAMVNTRAIAAKCNARLERYENALPKVKK
jgi:uracil-DNA glycosylase family 4